MIGAISTAATFRGHGALEALVYQHSIDIEYSGNIQTALNSFTTAQRTTQERGQSYYLGPGLIQFIHNVLVQTFKL